MMDDIINQMHKTMSFLTPARRVTRIRHELRLRDVSVTRIDRISPHFVRINFAGEALDSFVSSAFDDHVKFMFDDVSGRPWRRDYTPLSFDTERRELTLEFALHDVGPASNWARQARVGARAQIGGPKGSMVIDLTQDWHLLAGDATALPAIHRRLAELPAGQCATVLVQVPDEADRREFKSAAQLSVQWAHTPQAFLSALKAMRLPEGTGFAWCAGEAATMAQTREILVRDLNVPREDLRVSAYWKQGASDFHQSLEG